MVYSADVILHSMEGRTLRVRAPVNYKTEPGGTNTPGWLKSKTTPRVFNHQKPESAATKADKDKENTVHDQKLSKKQSLISAGTSQADQSAGLADTPSLKLFFSSALCQLSFRY